jgi:hypothetical protein
VIAKAGGGRWWTALSGRVKAQRAYTLAAGDQASKVDAVRDLGNYALCARGRFKLGRRLTLNSVVEAPDAHKMQQRLAQRLQQRRQAQAAAAAAASAAAEAEPAGSAPAALSAAPAATGASLDPAADLSSTSLAPSSSGDAPGAPELEPWRSHTTLRCVLPGHDLSATAGYNLQYVDSTGDVSHVPLAVSLDLASHDRQDGLQYRVGLHQVRLCVCVHQSAAAGWEGACSAGRAARKQAAGFTTALSVQLACCI